MGKHTTPGSSSRILLLGLLLGTLLLSTALNLYLLFQEPAYALEYGPAEAPLLESAAELELVQARHALAECQAGHPLPPDSLAQLKTQAGPVP